MYNQWTVTPRANIIAMPEILFKFLQPTRHFLKTVFVCNVVTQQTSVCAAVVQSRYTAKPFLARCIPDLKSHDGVRGCVEDAFGDKGRADGGGDFGGFKGVFDVPVYEGCFADACRC
jgi:hypothetical protein